MILDFLVRNLLEQALIFITVAFLINRRHYIFSNWKRSLTSIGAILLTAIILHVFWSMPNSPLMNYRVPIQIILFAIIYMFALKLNWLQSIIGTLIVLTTLVLSDGLGLTLLKITNSTYNESTFRLNNFQSLPSIIIMRTMQIVVLIIIAKLNIVIKIPDRFRIEKTVYKLVGSLSLLLFLVFGFLREVVIGAEEIQPLYILAIVASGGILCVIIIDYVRKNALQLKEIDKTRRRMRTGEICTEIIRNKSKQIDIAK